jgi:phage RecT family recombinase
MRALASRAMEEMRMRNDSNPSTVVATIEPAAAPYALRSPIADTLRSPEALAVIAPLIPKGVDFEEVLIEVYRAYTVNNDIARCTPPSIALAVGTAVQLGLQIGRTVHLVPVRTKVSKGSEAERYELRLNAWTDYKGDIELVVRSGAARHVDAQAVYEGDPLFDYELGDSPFVRHRPQLDAEKRGKLIAAYSVAYLTGGGTLKKIAVMSIADIEKVRKGSKQWNQEKLAICPEWYAVKTVIHRNCKTLPKNDRLAQVLALFERQEAADRGEDALDERPRELDPANRIGAPSSVDAGNEKPRPGQPTATHPSTDAGGSTDSREVQTPARPAHELWPMPFGAPYVGKPIGDVPTPDLEKLLQWAMRNGKQPEFVERAGQILDDRRWDAEADATSGARAE